MEPSNGKRPYSLENYPENLGGEPERKTAVLAKALNLNFQDLLDAKGKDDYNKWIEASFGEIAAKFLIGREVLHALNEKGEEYLKAYLLKKQQKYGDGGPFHSALKEARRHFSARNRPSSYGQMSEHAIKKAYRLAMRAFETDLSGVSQRGVEFSFNPDNWRKAEKPPVAQHFLAAMKEGVLVLVAWSGKIKPEEHELYLGSGIYGVAQKVYDIGNDCLAALKITLPREDSKVTMERSHEIVLQEAHILQCLHSGCALSKRGIQEEFRYVFNLNREINDSKIHMLAVLGKLYNRGDMETLILSTGTPFPDPEQIKEMVCQLFEGLSETHEQAIHGDIKNNNIFINHEVETNTWSACLADYGGGGEKNGLIKKATVENPFGTTASPGSFTYKDIVMSREIYKAFMKASPKDRERIKKTWILYQKARDVFALGSASWSLMTGEVPYDFCHSTRSDEEAIGLIEGIVLPATWHGLINRDANLSYIRKRYGKNFAYILEKCLDPNPLERPTARTVSAFLKNAIYRPSVLSRLEGLIITSEAP